MTLRRIASRASRSEASRFRSRRPRGRSGIYTIFSDQKLAAPPIAEQVRELRNKPNLTALDLRAPGRLVTDTLEFAPEPAQR